MNTSTPSTGLAGSRPVVLGGLVLGAAGIVVQIVAGVDYPTVPPGLVLLVLAALLVLLVRRTWTLAVGGLVALFLVVGGLLADPGFALLWDPPSTGAWLGAAVQAVGLVACLAAAAVTLSRHRR